MFGSTPGFGGARRDRTDDLKLAKLALSQLSYGPVYLDVWSSLKLVGLSGFEPLTSRLSGVCSNQLSYRPSEEQTARRRQFLVTVVPRGHTDRAELTEHSGKKEKRSRR